MKNTHAMARRALRMVRDAGVTIHGSNNKLVARLVQIHQSLGLAHFGAVNANGMPLEIFVLLEERKPKAPVVEIAPAVDTAPIKGVFRSTGGMVPVNGGAKMRRIDRRASKAGARFEPWHKRLRNQLVRRGRELRELSGGLRPSAIFVPAAA